MARRNVLAHRKPSKVWLAGLRRKGFTVRKVFDQGQHEDLKAKLLSIAGSAVVLPVVEPDKDILLNRGRLFSPRSLIMRKGAPCGCHSNSSHLWWEHADSLQLCTGYYMCFYGVWRQHSWCIGEDERIYETTGKGKAYYGVILSVEESLKFYQENI